MPEWSSLSRAGAQHLLGIFHSPRNQHSRAAVRIPLRSFGVAQVPSRAVQSQFWGFFLQSRDVQEPLGVCQALPKLGMVELRGCVEGQLKDV